MGGSSGVRDLTGVMNNDERHFSGGVNANDLQLKGLSPPPPPPQPPGVDLQDVTFPQAPCASVSGANALPSYSALLNEGFSYDHLFTEQNAFSSLELEGQQLFSDQNELLALPDLRPGFYPSASTLSAGLAPPPSAGTELDSPDDSEFSDIVLRYMQKLMEENMDEKFDVSPVNPALLPSEQPLHDILSESLLPSPDKVPLFSSYESHLPSPDNVPLFSSYVSDSPDGSIGDNHGNSSGSADGSIFINSSFLYDEPVGCSGLQIHPAPADESSESSFSSSHSVGNIIEGNQQVFLSMLAAPDLLPPSQPTWQFQKESEKAQKKFLPGKDIVVIDLEAEDFRLPQDTNESKPAVVKKEEEGKEHAVRLCKGRKNPHGEDLDLEEGRSIKQSAVFSDDTCRTPMIDEILLCHGEIYTGGTDGSQANLHNGKNKSSRKSHSKGSSGGKGQGKKHSKGEVVDLRTLLIHCAQAVAADDHRNANEFLKQIRQHSSPLGDANQRLAHWFADGLQARLAGTGSQIYHSLPARSVSVTDVLKAYKLYTAASPFRKISHFFSTQNILNVVGRATRLHIIDFGIYYGFQWPSFLQRLSKHLSRPPKVRITGIDLPVPGFRPAELIDETGRRLANYAHSFNIPFEYRSIASANWDTIQVEDLDLCGDEVLIVNCLFRFKSLMDETVSVDNPRDMVLNTIRKMNPNVFIHGVVNGTYGAPFFVTRFREALFHYSSVFDMIETNVQHEDESRQRIEKILFGREALNIIACEGTERLERPETYKQWHVRNLRAGFMQLPLNRDIMKRAKEKVRSCYHKDFVIDEDSQWLLQGWKGRILYALSTWKSNTFL